MRYIKTYEKNKTNNGHITKEVTCIYNTIYDDFIVGKTYRINYHLGSFQITRNSQQPIGLYVTEYDDIPNDPVFPTNKNINVYHTWTETAYFSDETPEEYRKRLINQRFGL